MKTHAKILSEGDVGRAILGKKDWKKMEKGVPSPRIFMNEKSPLNISVFILNQATDEELTEIADAMAIQRGPDRTFYGWGELSVANASGMGREVHRTPTPENDWHADVLLPATAANDENKCRSHAEKLASKCTIARPARRLNENDV